MLLGLEDYTATDPGQTPSTPSFEPLDRSRFENLLEVVGTKGAQELITRLTIDLQTVQSRMKAAISAADQAELRRQTHVLISLAGAVGADKLQRLAQTMNTAAHKMDQAAIQQMGQDADENINAVLRIIQTDYAGNSGGKP
jgi:HPt (histidine-containing phosphotransfer) domain-containing protein